MKAQIQPNLLDRVVGYFAPERAALRMRARMFLAIAGGFVGASYTRRSLSNWFVSPASADEDTVADLETLRARSRDMVRNTPLATGAVNTVVMNVVGTGLSLLPRPETSGRTKDPSFSIPPFLLSSFFSTSLPRAPTLCYEAPGMRPRMVILRAFLAAALAVVFGVPALAQAPELEKLAADVAKKLPKSGFLKSSPPTLIVFSFRRSNGEVSQLGKILAREFTSALLRQGRGIKILPLERLENIRNNEQWSETEMRDEFVARVVARHAGAGIVVVGRYVITGDSLELRVRAEKLDEGYELSDRRGKLPFSAAWKELDSQPLYGSVIAASTAGSTANAQPQETVFKAGRQAVGYPQCVSCPDPGYTKAAREEKYSATVVLGVIVTPEGKTRQVWVVRPAKFGLTENAIEAVKNWLFKPATNQEGKTVPVEVIIEVTFRLI